MLYGFFRSAGILSLAAVVARARGLVVLPILSRYLGTGDLGIWAQVGIIASTVFPLVMLGSDSGLTRLLPGLDPALQARRFAGWLVFLAAGASLAALAMLAARGPFALAFFGSSAEFAQYIPLVVASLFVSVLGNAARRWFMLRSDGTLLAASLVLQAVLSVAAILLAVALGRGLWEVIAYGVLADLASGLAALAVIAALGGIGRPDFGIVGPAVKFGLPLIPTAYAVWGLNWMDRIFLVHYQNFAAIGIYTAAYSIGYAVIEIFANPVWAMYPGLATRLHNLGSETESDRLLHATGGMMIAIVVPAIAGLWALDTPIITVIAGPGYAPGAAIVPIVALGYFFLMLSSFSDLALGLVYRQYLTTLSMTAAALVNLALNFLLIPGFGILGAAVATCAACLLHFLVSWHFAARRHRLWREFRHPLKIVIAAVAMAACVRAAGHLFSGPPMWQLLVLVPAGAVIYVVLADLMGAVQQEVKRACRARIVAFLGIGSR
jgi:O-antigen/teichoic acid export membrane protein